MIKDDFNYWAEEHYVIKKVTGTKQYCMSSFRNELKDFPSSKYSTHINNKGGTDDQYTVIIKRFVSEDASLKHCTFPPSYIRNGKDS
jgi:hypothetical protein